MTLSDAEASTIPNTPEDFSYVTTLQDDETFALLRPITPSAQKAFNASVNTIIIQNGSPEFKHYRQFLYAERGAGTARASSVFTEDEDEDKDEDADAGKPYTNQLSQQWNGAFKFSLQIPPKNGRIGWCLGTSRGHPNEIDILLASPTQKPQYGIAGFHMRLYFHEESYRMILQARHSITIGKSERIMRDSQSQVLDHKDLVVIGDCTYSFEYTSHFHSTNFQAEIPQYIQQTSGPKWVMNKLLAPASVGVPVPLGEFGEYFRSPNAFAQGTFGQVTVGWTRDGAAVAVKYFKKPKESEIESHKQLMEIIGNHDNILRLLDCFANFESPVPTAYCVYSPLAIMSLKDIINSYETNSATKIALLKDYLTGLSHLHGKGIMHRDIKPENLAIRSIQEPTGVILDLDAATDSPTSTDHMQGTIAYLAPEIVALKEQSTFYHAATPYEKNVDIWALGLSMFALMKCCRWSWRHFRAGYYDRSKDMYTEGKHNVFRRELQRLEEKASEPIETLLVEMVSIMTEVQPTARLSASELLQFVQLGTANMNFDISITPKQAVKRKMDDETETQPVKRQQAG